MTTESRLQPEDPIVSPVFLLSTPRAGSTMLRYLLDSHSRICSPGELGLGVVCHHLQMACSRTLGQVGSAGVPAETIARQEVRRIVAGMMQAYCRAKGKEIWCDKAPVNVDYAWRLLEIFPEARLICLHRHCLDMVHSSLELSRFGFMEELSGFIVRNPGNLVAALIEAWLDQTHKMLALERESPQSIHRITFESLVLRPHDTLPELFRFLAVDWEPEILQRAFVMSHDEGGGDPKAKLTRSLDSARIGKGSTIPVQTFPLSLWNRMNETLVQLGYPEVGPDWNERPSPLLPAQAKQQPMVLTLEDLFLFHIPAALERNAEQLAPIEATIKFVITGRESGIWTVDLKELQVLSTHREADCTIRTDSEVLLAIANKSLDPFSAFQQGKVQVQGQMDLVYKVPLLLEVVPAEAEIGVGAG